MNDHRTDFYHHLILLLVFKAVIFIFCLKISYEIAILMKVTILFFTISLMLLL